MKKILTLMLLCATVLLTSCKDDDPVMASAVSLDKSALSLVEGTTGTLTATITPDNVDDKSLAWKSSNEAVATVDSKGMVTAVSVGEATITVVTISGEKSATCVVTVTPAPILVTGIILDKAELSLDIEATAQLVATIAPADATNQNMTWSSSKPEVATVAADGTITPVTIGETSITVTTEDGNFTASCKLTVTEVTGFPWYLAGKKSGSFEIGTVEDLKGLGLLVNGDADALAYNGFDAAYSFEGKNVKLTANIDLGNEEWAPIGTNNVTPFKGEFDGNGKVITGLKISSGNYVGLFGYLGGNIKDLRVEGGTVSGSRAGSIAGVTGRTIVVNCSSSTTVSGLQAGGLIGNTSSETSVFGCFATGNVSGMDSDDCYTGGLIGSNSATVIACYSTGKVVGGNVSTKKSSITGGLMGVNSWTATVTNCYTLSTVTKGLQGKLVLGAGAIGYNQNNSDLVNYLLYVTDEGDGIYYGIDEGIADKVTVKGIPAAKLSENIDWLNTGLPGDAGYKFKADGTLEKVAQ